MCLFWLCETQTVFRKSPLGWKDRAFRTDPWSRKSHLLIDPKRSPDRTPCEKKALETGLFVLRSSGFKVSFTKLPLTGKVIFSRN